jgi:hypothetical protein
MIDNFKDWLPFSKNDTISNDDIIKYHNEFSKRYPELKKMKLESDYYNKTKYWSYSMKNIVKDLNIEIYLEISRKENWSFTFELISKSNINEMSFMQEDKIFEKKNVDWEELNFNLQKVILYLRKWNKEFSKEFGFSLFEK